MNRGTFIHFFKAIPTPHIQEKTRTQIQNFMTFWYYFCEFSEYMLSVLIITENAVHQPIIYIAWP